MMWVRGFMAGLNEHNPIRGVLEFMVYGLVVGGFP